MQKQTSLLRKLLRPLKKRLSSHPGFSEIDFAIQNGRPDQALSRLQKLPDSLKQERTFLERLARAYQDLQYWPEASDAWTQVIQLDPNAADAMISLAVIQYELGHIEHARNALKKAADSETARDKALLRWIDIERKQKNWPAAEEILTKLRQTQATPARLHSLAFDIAIHRQDLEAASSILTDGAAKGCAPHEDLDQLDLAIAARDADEANQIAAQIKNSRPDTNDKRYTNALLRLYELTRDYARAITLLENDVQSSDQNPLAIAELARVLIMANQTGRALHEIERIPNAWDRHRRVAPLRAFSLTQQNRHEEAKASWNQVTFWSALHAYPNLTASVPLIHKGSRISGTAPVKLYTTVRNEALRLPWFLSYYRSIGIEEFYIIDNGSTDSTVDYLKSQDDVALFQTQDSFRDNLGGTYWINHLIEQYGAADWALYVDVDEFLQLPGLLEEGINAIVTKLESRGDEAVFAPMLDMFPEHLQDSHNYRAGDDPLTTCPYFDNSLEIYGQPESPYKKVHGGASERFAGQKGIDVLTKTPLFHAKKNIKLFYISHKTTPAKLSSMTGALLHFKFLGPFIEFLQSEMTRNDHFGVSRRYALLADTLGKGSQTHSLIGPKTVKFESPEQLVELGIISHFTD